MELFFLKDGDLVFFSLVVSSLAVTIMMLGTLAVFRFKHRQRAALRYQFWYFGLILLGWSTLFGMLAPLFVGRHGEGIQENRTSTHWYKNAQEQMFERIEYLISNRPLNATRESSVAAYASETGMGFLWPTVKQMFVFIWMIGFLVLIARMFLRRWHLYKFQKGLHLVSDKHIKTICRQLAKRLEISGRQEIFFSGETVSPLALGMYRSRIILPLAAAQWSQARMECVLAHELAHIKRGDVKRQCLAHLIAACHWFNPFAWLALAEMRKDREEICDDMAIGLGMKPSEYATALLHLSDELKTSSWKWESRPAMAEGSEVGHRIHAVLDVDRNRQDMHSTIRRIILVVPLALGLLLGMVTPNLSLLTTSSREVIQKANRAFEERNWKTAVALFKTLDEGSPGLALDWYRYAYSLEQTGNMVEGFRALQRSLQSAGYPDPALFCSVSSRKIVEMKGVEGEFLYEGFESEDPKAGNLGN